MQMASTQSGQPPQPATTVRKTRDARGARRLPRRRGRGGPGLPVFVRHPVGWKVSSCPMADRADVWRARRNRSRLCMPSPCSLQVVPLYPSRSSSGFVPSRKHIETRSPSEHVEDHSTTIRLARTRGPYLGRRRMRSQRAGAATVHQDSTVRMREMLRGLFRRMRPAIPPTLFWMSSWLWGVTWVWGWCV